MVRDGAADAAMVPIENSVEGGVTATLDAIASGEQLRIIREALVPISFVLVARPGLELSDIRRISTHGHAWAQCRHWVQRQYSGCGIYSRLVHRGCGSGPAGRGRRPLRRRDLRARSWP